MYVNLMREAWTAVFKIANVEGEESGKPTNRKYHRHLRKRDE